jgi:HlyD family secretion protein
LFIIALTGSIVTALIYGFLPAAIMVEVAPVVRGPLQVTIEAEGKTRVRNRYVISAPVAGIARRIELDVGDPVSAGQILAWLAPLRSQVLDSRSRAQAQARLAAAEAALRVARAKEQAAIAGNDYAVAERNRLRRLAQTGVVSQDTLDQAEAEARRSEAEWRSAVSAVEVAQYELEAARSELRFSAAREAGESESIEQVTLTAPVDGTVLKVHQRSEYVVEPGRPLLEIGDPRDLEVEVDVLSVDAVSIAPGSRVVLQRWGGSAELEGRVRLVEPIGFTKISALGVEEQRVLVIVDIVSPPEEWQRLGDGYRVEAEFILWENDNVLRIPSNALLRTQQGWAVFVVQPEDDTARRRQVTPGRRSGFYTEIVAGLSVGQTVITHPDDKLSDGSKVAPR